jgi:formate dehydrogenase major subunit
MARVTKPIRARVTGFLQDWSLPRQLKGADAMGEAAKSTASRTLRPRLEQADRVGHGVCPYCAVGCGQIAHTVDGKIVNIEGNPDSPINRGTLCPKGAATYQLAVNPNRVTRVWYRAPGATDWDKTKTLQWAMDRIAQRVRQTRDATFRATAKVKGPDGKEVERRVNHTTAIASLGGATLDIEWNYVQAKLMRALGVVCIENQARI